MSKATEYESPEIDLTQSSNEMFYRDKNGRKSDANIHEWILANGVEEPVEYSRREAMRILGISYERAAVMYPTPAEMEKWLAASRK